MTWCELLVLLDMMMMLFLLLDGIDILVIQSPCWITMMKKNTEAFEVTRAVLLIVAALDRRVAMSFQMKEVKKVQCSLSFFPTVANECACFSNAAFVQLVNNINRYDIVLEDQVPINIVILWKNNAANHLKCQRVASITPYGLLATYVANSTFGWFWQNRLLATYVANTDHMRLLCSTALHCQNGRSVPM